jgi:probable F420-dependent oxidoreductase
MRVGVQFPYHGIMGDAAATRDFAQAAEGLGYSHLLIYEHVIGAQQSDRTPPLAVAAYDEKTEFHESLTLLAYLSAVTGAIGLASGIVVMPQRETVLLAKQSAEVAMLSGDRLRLGVGVGHNYVEFEALGADFATRGARCDEQIEVLRALWGQDLVDFRGKWHTLSRVAIAPRPRAQVPIWIGGFSEPAYRRAARLADGLIYSLMGTAGPDPDPEATIQRVRDMVSAHGRDASAFGVELLAPIPVPPAELAELVARWAPTGIDYLTLHLPYGYESPAHYIADLQPYMEAARNAAELSPAA